MESEGFFSIKPNLFRLRKKRWKAGLQGQYGWWEKWIHEIHSWNADYKHTEGNLPRFRCQVIVVHPERNSQAERGWEKSSRARAGGNTNAVETKLDW